MTINTKSTNVRLTNTSPGRNEGDILAHVVKSPCGAERQTLECVV